MNNFLEADWSAPANIGAGTTTRRGGKSTKPFDSNNMALDIGDVEAAVRANHESMIQALELNGEPAWLKQTHTNECIVLEETHSREADAAVTRSAAQPLVITTADCLPILLCNKGGNEIAAIHAGWRGLANGIIENTVKTMKHHTSELIAWIGPGICGSCFEIGDDVQAIFVSNYPNMLEAFHDKNGKSYADLAMIAYMILTELRLSGIYRANKCTKEDENDFYSYRRDGETGRMATLIWFKEDM